MLTTSRFFRDATKARICKHQLKKKGVRVIAAHQETEDDPMGHLLEGLFELIDEYESQMNGFHTGRAMRENARRGYLNNKPKFGFKAEVVTDEKGNKKKKPVVDDDEAVLIRRVFTMAAAGKGTLTIAQQLNGEGLRQRSGKKWTKMAVFDVLRETAHKGKYVVNKRDFRNGGFRPEEEWITIEVPAIVPVETWDRVAQLMASRAPVVENPRVAGSHNLLTGLLRCGHCGAIMTVETAKKNKYRYYQCRTQRISGNEACVGFRVRVENLERAVLKHLKLELFSPERVRAMLEGLAVSMVEVAQERVAKKGALESKKRGVEARLENQYRAIEEKLVVDEDVGMRMRELRAEIEDIEAELVAMGDPSGLPKVPTDDEAVERFTDNVEEMFLGDQEFARTYLRTVLDKIVMDRGVVQVHARAAGVAQAAVGAELTSSGVVPHTVISGLRRTDLNRQPSG